MFKKRTKMIFEFEEVEGGFTIKVKTKGNVCDKHVYGIKQFIDEKIKASNGKNKRK